MHSTVTVGGLIGVIGGIIGILFLSYGVLTFLADCMSDSTSDTDKGFLIPLCTGIMLIGLSIWLIL